MKIKKQPTLEPDKLIEGGFSPEFLTPMNFVWTTSSPAVQTISKTDPR